MNSMVFTLYFFGGQKANYCIFVNVVGGVMIENLKYSDAEKNAMQKYSTRSETLTVQRISQVKMEFLFAKSRLYYYRKYRTPNYGVSNQ